MSKTGFDSFEGFHRQAQGTCPAWLKPMAIQAGKRFLEKGLPDRHSEEWKYTDLNFVKNFKGQPGHQISGLTQSVPFSKLSPTQISEWENLRNFLNEWQKDTTFENLNLALSSEGSYLRVKEGAKETFSFTVTSEGSSGTWFSPRTVVFVEENAEATIFERDLLSEGEIQNSFVDISLAKGAKLTYIRHQDNARLSNHISTTRVLQASGSQFKYFNFAFGSDVSRDNVLCQLSGGGAHCELRGLAVSKPGQHLDQFVFIDHKSPNATSQQLFKNIISSRARAVFNGGVLVQKGSSGTDAKQLNRNLLLGKLAEIDTRPQLEIFNDDVKCSHGASIGRLSADELFYLESRGISKKMSIDMLCRAFVNEVVLLVDDQGIRDQLSKSLNQHFSQLETDHGP